MADKSIQTKLTNGFLQVPNFIFDNLQPHLTPAAFSVLLIVFRSTLGWQQMWAKISAKQFANRSNVSVPTAIKAYTSLIEDDFITREKLPQEHKGLPEYIYALSFSDELLKEFTYSRFFSTKESLAEVLKDFKYRVLKNLESLKYNRINTQIQDTDKIDSNIELKSIPEGLLMSAIEQKTNGRVKVSPMDILKIMERHPRGGEKFWLWVIDKMPPFEQWKIRHYNAILGYGDKVWQQYKDENNIQIFIT